jgi:glycosyltransferase involved in cell wall biosynthesis
MSLNFSQILLYVFLFWGGMQVSYWLFFLIGLLRLKKFTPDNDSSIGISIIVAARNELNQLRALIPALVNQDYQNFEVIIVNDRSDDGTLEFLRSEATKHTRLKGVDVHDLPDHITGKKYALTLGIKAAQYNHLIFTDADCLPKSSKWIAQMANGYARGGDFILGFSGYTKLKGFLNYFIRFETLLTGIEYLGSAANKMPYMGIGRNMGYKRDVFLENKGFLGMQSIIGGDDDLFVNKYAKGKFTQVVVGEEALVQTDPKLTWRDYLSQKHRHMSVGKQYSTKSKLALGMFNISWFLFYAVGIMTLLYDISPIYTGGTALLRMILVIITFGVATKKFETTFQYAGVILVDFVYPIYYIFVALKALFVKRISW